jgi:alkylation response protein AidB-like acyl-CoA dehydrogenase
MWQVGDSRRVASDHVPLETSLHGGSALGSDEADDREKTMLMDEGERTDASSVLERIRRLTAAWDSANGDEAFPADRITALHRAGAGAAFVDMTGDAAVTGLRDALRQVGGADLSLGRVFEGHVNAVQIVHAYGDATQRAALAADIADGRTFGVWNTEPAPGMTVEIVGDKARLVGAKSFATGAGHIDRALITARDADGAKRLVLVDIAGATGRVDNSGWRVRGMRGTASGVFDFTGMRVGSAALIGGAGDYEREPRFSAGAWRFTAVQLGAIEALVRHWRDHLAMTGKGGDPIQRARFAAAVVATRSAGQWVAQAAQAAETEAPGAIPLVLMTRGVVEEAGLLAMEGAARAVGTASFFDQSRIDRITRDLGLYLRQPVPDQARDRAAAAWLDADHWGEDRWW